VNDVAAGDTNGWPQQAHDGSFMGTMSSQQGRQKNGTGSLVNHLPQAIHSTGTKNRSACRSLPSNWFRIAWGSMELKGAQDNVRLLLEKNPPSVKVVALQMVVLYGER